MEGFGITRPFSCNYVGHWKSKLMDWELIDPTSLTFQEDESFLYSVLNYPNPIRNWSTWPTLCFYCLKVYASQSAGALSLHRGATKTRLGNIEDEDVKLFTCSINHPGPSLSTLAHKFPLLNYSPQIYHREEHLFHIKILQKNSTSVKIVFPNVVRFLITVGADDQELNQGTFIHNDKLYGLKKPMSVAEIQSIGLQNLAKHISEQNGFLTSVREFRGSDFGGLCCSNIYTSLEAGSVKTKACKDELMAVLKLLRKCQFCLENNKTCIYENLNEQCQPCRDSNVTCQSLSPFHVLWDMAEVQRGAAAQLSTITSSSSSAEFMSASTFTLGFGGLHIAKALINPSRNCVLTFKGENHGIHILRAYKKHPSLNGVKNAVFLARDRQSDQLAKDTCDDPVQTSLKEIKNYHVVRTPEPLMRHHENCKSQKLLINPVSMTCNKNGDVLILDSASSCLHGVDRTIVSKVVTVGSYGLSDYSSKKQHTAADMKMSADIRDMVILNDVLYIADPQRGEVIIINNVADIRFIPKSQLLTLAISDCLSLSAIGSDIAALQKNEGKTTVKIISHDKVQSYCTAVTLL